MENVDMNSRGKLGGLMSRREVKSIPCMSLCDSCSFSLYTHACTHTHTHTCTHTCTIMYILKHTHAHIYIYTQTHTYIYICTCTVGVKKTVMFPFRSVPFERRPFHPVHPFRFHFARASEQLICWVCFATCQKSMLACSLVD